MFLFTLVLGVLFLPEADSLNCKCEGKLYGFCSNETTVCPSQYDRCSAATQVTSPDGKVTEFNHKGCIKSELCFDYSVSNGANRIVQNSSCCSGDLCNTLINYTKPDNTSNGKRCFSCDGDENCMKTLNCVGDESHCFKVTNNSQGVTMMMKGCASEVVCSDVFSPVLKWLVSLVSNQFTEPKISCCQGDYCNNASSPNSTSITNSTSSTSTPSPTLLLLLVSLLFSNLFS